MPGLDEGAPELTRHSGLTLPEVDRGHGTQARDSPLLRSDPSWIPYYVHVDTYMPCVYKPVVW